MTRQNLAVAGVVVVAAALIGAVLLLSSSNDPNEPATLEESLLRRTDLPPGYTIGDDSGCGVITPEGRPPALDRLLGMTFPEACHIQLERPGSDEPFHIDSAAVDFPSVEMASAAMDIVPQLGRRVIGSSESLTPEPSDFEDEAVLMRFREVNTQAEGVVFAWRSGRRVNLISVAGNASPDILTYTRKLAEVQQKRSGDAERITASDTDDRIVPLDRPNLGSVYWLDVDFAPSGQPALTLESAQGPLVRESSPGNRIQISYRPASTSSPRAGLEVAIWDTAVWADFVQTELGDRSTQTPCGEPQVIQLADRRIEIHAPGPPGAPPLHLPVASPLAGPPGQFQPLGNSPNAVEDQCPRNYIAQVHFKDAVVVLNGIYSTCCDSAGGVYDSAAAIEAAARGLRKR